MSKYNIKRWNPVILHNQTYPFPAIYIKPDKKFSDFAKKNKNTIRFKVVGSDTMYDNTFFKGVVSDMPDVLSPPCKWISKNGYVAITMDALWVQYPDPDKLGSILVYMDNKDTEQIKRDKNKSVKEEKKGDKSVVKEKFANTGNTKCYSTINICLLIIIISMLCLGVMLLYKM